MQDISDRRRRLTSNLVLAGRQWRKTVDSALTSFGVSEASTAPLLWIHRLGNGVRQVILANHVGIEGPSLVRLLDLLEAQGLIERKADPNDRRAKSVCLTDTGSSLAQKLEKRLDQLREKVMTEISEADIEVTLRVLDVFEGVDAARLWRDSEKEDNAA